MWIPYVILGFVLVLCFTLLLLYVVYLYNYWYYSQIPHEPAKKLLHVCRAALSASLDAKDSEKEHYQQLYWKHKGTGPFCGFYSLLQPRVLVLDRELVRQILITDFSNFNGRGIYYNSQQDPLSGNLYSLCGSRWKEMRLKLEPIFCAAPMVFIYQCVYTESIKLQEAVQLALQQNATVNIKEHLQHYVLESFATYIFGLAENLRNKYPLSEFKDMVQLALESSRHGRWMNAALKHYPSLGRRLHFVTTTPKVENYFLTLIEYVVNQREINNIETKDFLQLLISIKTMEQSTHETEEHTNAKQLKSHLINELAAHAFTFLRSGYEPLVHTLTYVLYEIAVHQDIQQKLREEILFTLSQHNEELSNECVQQLQYMEQVILETVRLHPFRAYLVRRALQDYNIPHQPKYTIHKGMHVIIPLYALQNDPLYHTNPQLFRPERFAQNVSKLSDSWNWLGFGEGPRSCIGVLFSQLHMRVTLAQLLLHYKFFADAERGLSEFASDNILRVETLVNDKFNNNFSI